MAEKTGISWTQHSWNPWRGCHKVSPGCAHCYMFTEQRRYGNDPNTVMRTKTWGAPLKWQKAAAAAGRTEMVFTCSWSDWFIKEADDWRNEAWDVIRRCPNLIFQILTKRPERITGHLPIDWPSTGYPNVWLGVSIESNHYVNRADILRRFPAAVRFISYEPALGPIDQLDLTGIGWLICGGESGPNFRQMDIQWARDVRDRCKEYDVPFFFKQGNGLRSGMNTELDGEIIQEFPNVSKV